ncbi:unnamed protein product [Ectocarpus sp. 12 AP-2014]
MSHEMGTEARVCQTPRASSCLRTQLQAAKTAETYQTTSPKAQCSPLAVKMGTGRRDTAVSSSVLHISQRTLPQKRHRTKQAQEPRPDQRFHATRRASNGFTSKRSRSGSGMVSILFAVATNSTEDRSNGTFT